MYTTRTTLPLAFAVVIAAACGDEPPADGSGEPDLAGDADGDPSGATGTTAELAQYQQLTLDVQEGATMYGSTMMGSETTTTADCRRVYDAYDELVRPWVSQMVAMSGRMDRHMDSNGGEEVADYGCAVATMMDELDLHRATACTLNDIRMNRAEAARHVDAMLNYSEHLWERCEQMMRGIDTGAWAWGPMMTGCETWDDDCGMMHDGCCSEMGRMHGASCEER
jgi:hypothetical protein